MNAAIFRSPEIPALLTRAYAKDFSDEFELSNAQAIKIIRQSENEFREKMVLYGIALLQDNAFDLIVEDMADLAEVFWKLMD